MSCLKDNPKYKGFDVEHHCLCRPCRRNTAILRVLAPPLSILMMAAAFYYIFWGSV